jgi:hypothetical protein
MSDALIAGRQASAHRMIQRWGGVGYLIRNGVQRACTMARMEYSPRERGLYADKSSRIRVSMIGLAVLPDHEQDEVIYKGERYKILQLPEGPRVTDVFVYIDLNVMFSVGDEDPSFT